jgi:hypothetical protein
MTADNLPDRQPAEPPPSEDQSRKQGISGRLRAVAWGLFFVWLGARALMHLSWDWTLVGIGGIILAEQMIRASLRIGVSGLWMATGVIFVIAGLWDRFNLDWPIGPVMFIVLGAGILWHGIFGRGETS